MKKPKVFVLGVPHTQTTQEFTTCAFTTNVWNLCKMLYENGYEVIHLGTEGSNPICTEHVSVTSKEMWEALYKRPKQAFHEFKSDGRYAFYHQVYINHCVAAINARVDGPYESIICVPWGDSQRTVTEKTNHPQIVTESGVGYRHSFSKYRAFPSYAWMHFIHGTEKKDSGNTWYDVVIPHAVEQSYFEFKDKKDDYFLFLGRLNDDKGVRIAVDITKHVGAKLKIVGQGDPTRFLAGNSHVEYLPPAGIEERKALLANAKALICPTQYVEPFGYVAVEAQMSGTPVISTDWGGFTETVQHETTGYRCRTFKQFVEAANQIDKIDPLDCRLWAKSYTLEAIAPKYINYFNMLVDLHTKTGWYTI